MKKNMMYNGYTAESDLIKWFWEILQDYEDDMRAMFIFFVTGIKN